MGTPLDKLVLELIAAKIDYEIEFDFQSSSYLIVVFDEHHDHDRDKGVSYRFTPDGQRV